MAFQYYPPTSPVYPRPRPMKVLVLGLPRTGTFSLYTALRQLGLNSYHFAELVKNKNNRHFQLWLQALQNKYFLGGEPFEGDAFDQMLWDYDAILDTPGCFFVEELIAAYPDAKVILTTRTRESWLRSMQNTLLDLITWRSWTVLALFDRDFSAPYWALFNCIMRVFSPEMSLHRHDRQPAAVPHLLQFFDDHHSLVRRVVPKDRLLEFHPSHGWEPLCKFLDLPIPEEEFPHTNEPVSFGAIHRHMYWKRWSSVVRKLAATVGAGGFVLMWAWWWKQ